MTFEVPLHVRGYTQSGHFYYVGYVEPRPKIFNGIVDMLTAGALIVHTGVVIYYNQDLAPQNQFFPLTFVKPLSVDVGQLLTIWPGRLLAAVATGSVIAFARDIIWRKPPITQKVAEKN